MRLFVLLRGNACESSTSTVTAMQTAIAMLSPVVTSGAVRSASMRHLRRLSA
jgi:hypothetical protein